MAMVVWHTVSSQLDLKESGKVLSGSKTIQDKFHAITQCDYFNNNNNYKMNFPIGSFESSCGSRYARQKTKITCAVFSVSSHLSMCIIGTSHHLRFTVSMSSH